MSQRANGDNITMQQHPDAVRRPYKILIAENVPASNKGEMAIVRGLIESLEGLPCEVSLLSFFPEFDGARYAEIARVVNVREAWPSIRDAGPRTGLLASIDVMVRHYLFALSVMLFGAAALRIWRAGLWHAYLDADIIVYGHDSSFGLGGTQDNPLFYPIYLPQFAHLLGKRTMFFAGTVPRHPSRRFPRLSSWLFRFSLLRADAITLREEFSLQNMKRARAERGDVQVTADVAYLLKPASSERVAQIFDIEQIPQDRPLIGMTISKVRAVIAYPDSSPSQSYRKHIEMMARIVDRIVDVSGATIILLPHSIGMDGNGDDRLVAQDIRESCRQRVNVFSISGEYGPEELKGVIGRCQMFVGERLHSVIGATTLGVPAIAMSYAADTRLAMVRPMVTDDYVIPLENLDEEALIDKIRRLWQQRASVAEALNERAISMRRRARVNGEVLRRLLEQQD